jgi:transcriptional regulator with XRE-family HTH domain
LRQVAISSDNTLEIIARRLARVRADSGLNQGQFAERLGFPKRTYLGWERAETEPPIWMLTAMRRELGVDPDWILHGPGDTPRRHAHDFDWERLGRLQEEIYHYVAQVGLALTTSQLLVLARTVFEEGVEAEASALGRMKTTIKALASGRL